MADEVVFVQPLHDDDNRTRPLVIEPAVKGVGVPVIRGFALHVGDRLVRFQGIVDQDEVSAASGQHAAGGGRSPVSLAGGDEFLHGLPMAGGSGRSADTTGSS